MPARGCSGANAPRSCNDGMDGGAAPAAADAAAGAERRADLAWAAVLVDRVELELPGESRVDLAVPMEGPVAGPEPTRSSH